MRMMCYGCQISRSSGGGEGALVYADDLVIPVQPKTEVELQLPQRTVEAVFEWITKAELTFDPHKRKIVFLIDKLECHEIETKITVRYVGLVLDRGLGKTPHIRVNTTKVASTASKLAKIMPNIHEAPGATRRRIVTAVVELSFSTQIRPCSERGQRRKRTGIFFIEHTDSRSPESHRRRTGPSAQDRGYGPRWNHTVTSVDQQDEETLGL